MNINYLKRIITKKPKREWSKGLSGNVIEMVRMLSEKDMTSLIFDLGAGEGRHSIYALKNGIHRVHAIELDEKQVEILIKLQNKFPNLGVTKADVTTYLREVPNNSVDGIIDCGMSHCLENNEEKRKLANTVYNKLKPNGLYTITHFSENEVLVPSIGATLNTLKKLYSTNKWKEVKPWHKISWKRHDGKKHYAYTSILEKKSQE